LVYCHLQKKESLTASGGQIIDDLSSFKKLSPRMTDNDFLIEILLGQQISNISSTFQELLQAGHCQLSQIHAYFNFTSGDLDNVLIQ